MTTNVLNASQASSEYLLVAEAIHVTLAPVLTTVTPRLPALPTLTIDYVPLATPSLLSSMHMLKMISVSLPTRAYQLVVLAVYVLGMPPHQILEPAIVMSCKPLSEVLILVL